MKTPKIKPKTAAQLVVVEMSDLSMQWTSQAIRRDGLPEGHQSTFYGIWQDKRIIMLCTSYDDASLFAELEADRLGVPLVDLVSGHMRLAPDDEWIEVPTG